MKYDTLEDEDLDVDCSLCGELLDDEAKQRLADELLENEDEENDANVFGSAICTKCRKEDEGDEE